MTNNQQNQTNISQELVPVTDKLNQLVKKDISVKGDIMEERRRDPWNPSFNMLGWKRSRITFFTCDCCGKDRKGSMEGDHRLLGFALERNPKVDYWHRDTEWNKKYCRDCHESGVFQFQALVKKNN